jgi:hypothetical protein
MTSQEMEVAFKQGLDKFDSLNYPDFQTDQIELLLNQAQDAFVKQRYGVSNAKRQSFEETQKRTEDLKNLVTNAILIPAVNAVDNINSNARFVTLPTNHWFIIQELTGISYVGCNGSTVTDRVFTEAIQHNDYSKIINNPFAQPNEGKILRLMEAGRVELISSTGVTITDYHLRYIKEPVRISVTNSVDCELSEQCHQEIVSISISLALEGIESKRLTGYISTVENRNE